MSEFALPYQCPRCGHRYRTAEHAAGCADDHDSPLDHLPWAADEIAVEAYSGAVLFPIQAASERVDALLTELTDLGVKVDAVLPDGTHLYWCTSHRHGDPDHCASPVSVHGGGKVPGRSKCCGAVCREAT